MGFTMEKSTTMVRNLPLKCTENVDDFSSMLTRAESAGIQKIIVTGTSLSESQRAIELASKYGIYRLNLLLLICLVNRATILYCWLSSYECG